jgi:hemerythrin-like domain-containing protein
MNELKRIENERKERERIISQDVQKFVQQQDPHILTTNNSIQRTISSSSRRSSINQDYLQRFNNSSNRISTTQKIVKKIKFLFYFISKFLFFVDNI